MVGDGGAAELGYPQLEPFSGTNVMIGHLVSCYGSADRYLGMLAATLGRFDRAYEHFERAIELNSEMGAQTWLGPTYYEDPKAPPPAGSRPDPPVARLPRAAPKLPAP